MVVVAEEPDVDFSRDVRPIFNRHCTSCHGGVTQAAGISFVYADQVVAPDGWIVEPGDPEASGLIERIISEDPDERMPPPEHGPALSPEEVETLTKWIQQGANWSKHWAFEKPQPQEPPATENSEWARQSIDYFVLAKLESKGIRPAADAPPERWLRRATLDLVGLPPTLEERANFLKDLSNAKSETDSEQVYVDVVQRLLESESFGERWASVWLDQVRYADSKGLGIDGRRTIWKYRDWVIDAFNRDMPFDEFTIKQIAGDLLPGATLEDRIATAVHRLTQTNEEGGTDDEEFRIAAVLDRTNTTWQAWQGVTFGCVQCHSHPYDPIRHQEYYQFAAFFNNTADSDLGEDWPIAKVPFDTSKYAIASELDRKILQLKQDIWKSEFSVASNSENWQNVTGLAAKTNRPTKVAVEVKANREEFHTVDTVSKGTQITVTGSLPAGMSELTAVRATTMPLDPEKALTDSEWGFMYSHVGASLVVSDGDPIVLEFNRVIGDEADPFHDPMASLNGKSKQGFGAYTRIYRPRSAVFVLKSPVEIPAGAKLKVTLNHKGVALGAFPLVSKRGYLEVSSSDKFATLASDKTLKQKRKRLGKLKARRAAIKSTTVPVCKERPASLARSQQVFIRGLYLTKGETVSANTPQAFRALDEDSQPDRLALAKWMVDAENPLTARVAVNRLWARVFGSGIVFTEEDFGSSGEAPSHPGLLDFLALKFQNEYRWSQKKLLRELVLSRTYRQSSVIRKDIQKFDSANRLLARGPRPRLSSEIVRDQALAISGLLSSKKFGPPVRPPIPDGVWRPFAKADKWDTPDAESEDRYRRAIYTYTKRSIPYPMLAAFDAPSREVCTPRRLQSNTPIQALMSLNDQTMVECAQAFAKRMRAFAGEPGDRIRKGFLLATGREPTGDEVKTVSELLDVYSEKEKLRAWNSVANVLLNLDEVLTK